VTEGIARVARAVAAVGGKYDVTVCQVEPNQAGVAEGGITAPILALLRHGIDDGTLRNDLTVEELGYVLGSLLRGSARPPTDLQRCPCSLPRWGS
jgi:hypothetical protein